MSAMCCWLIRLRIRVAKQAGTRLGTDPEETPTKAS